MQKWTYRVLQGCIVIVTLLSLLVILGNPLNVNADIAYFIDGALRILDGERPYVDFFNVNLLTIQYLYVIPVVISKITGFHAVSIWMISTWVQMLVSMGVSYRLTKIAFKNANPSFHLSIPLSLGFISWVMLFTVDFGQREHLFALYAVPWILLRYCTYEGYVSQSKIYFFAGLLLAVVASIKPYFVLAIIVIEFYWIVRYRNLWKIFTFEIYGVIVAGLIYIGFLIINPDMLEGMVDTIQSAVLGYRNRKDSLSNETIVPHFQIPLLIGLVIFAISWMRDEGFFRFIGGLAVFTLMGATLVVFQAGSNIYLHSALFMGAMVCVSVLITSRHSRSDSDVPSHNISYAGIFLLLFITLFSIGNTAIYWTSLTTIRLETPKELQEVVESYSKPGDDVLFLSSRLGDMMPWLRLIDRNQASSYMTTWALITQRGESLIDNSTLQKYRDITAKDLNKQPRLLIIDITDTMGVGSFLEETELDDFIYSHYRFVKQIESYAVYVQVGDPPVQGVGFNIGDRFTLYSWEIETPNEELVACDTITIHSWWEPSETKSVNPYTANFLLIHNDNVVVDSVGRLGGLEDYSSQSSIIDTRELSLPCEVEDGDYQLLISLENSLEEEVLSVTSTDGAGYGNYVFLKQYVVQGTK